MKQPFEILNYNPVWKEMYKDESSKLINIFGDNLSSIHHIGSTAIPNTWAKPEIDILLVVNTDSNLSAYDKPIEALGYVVRGECLENGGTPGRYYYSKDINTRRTHKLHICQIGHPEILAKLIFVKYLNDHKEAAIQYAKLKIRLSKTYNYGRNIQKYLTGKHGFIMDVLDKAYKENDLLKYEDFM